MSKNDQKDEILKLSTIIYEKDNQKIVIQFGILYNVRLISGFFQNHKFITKKFIDLINRNTSFEKIAKKKTK